MKYLYILVFIFPYVLRSQTLLISADQKGITVNNIFIEHRIENNNLISALNRQTLEDLLEEAGLPYRKKKTKEHIEYRVLNSKVIFYYDLRLRFFVMGYIDFELDGVSPVFMIEGLVVNSASTFKSVCGNTKCVSCEDIITSDGSIYQGGCHMYMGNFSISYNFELNNQGRIRFMNFHFF